MICIDAVTVMHFSAFLIYLLFAAAVYNGGIIRMQQRMLLFMLLFVFAFISFSRAVFFNSCASREMAAFGVFITAPFWISNSAIAFLLALGYSGKNKLAKNKYRYIIIFIYTAVFTVMTWFGMVHSLVKIAHGWSVAVTGLYGFFYSRIDDLLVIGCIVVLAYQTYKEEPGLIKKQGVLILIAATVTVLLLYAVKLFKGMQFVQIPSNITLLILMTGMAAATKFYGFIELTPAFAASSVFNTSSEMMLLVEADGTIAKANTAYVKKTGTTEEEIERSNLSAVLEGGTAAFAGLMKNALDKNAAAAQMRIKASGEWRFCHISVSLLKRGQVLAGAVIVMSDITELNQTQDELKRYKDTLEAMVAKRTLDLDMANMKLMKKAETAVEFTKASHHDLMEPVIGIANLLQLVKLRNKDKLDSDSNCDIDETVGYAIRLHSLIKDMREYINVDYLAGENMPGSPSAALKEAIEECTNKIEIHYDKMPDVYCPKSLLKDIFTRLIDNSIRFSGKADTKIWVASKLKGNEVEFSFEDDGVGVNQAYFEKIFGVFERLLDRANYPGNGMGLAICKKIAELHGGRIWAQKSDKGGLAVKMILKAV